MSERISGRIYKNEIACGHDLNFKPSYFFYFIIAKYQCLKEAK